MADRPTPAEIEAARWWLRNVNYLPDHISITLDSWQAQNLDEMNDVSFITARARAVLDAAGEGGRDDA